jgi:hypothetical protein
VIEPSGRGYSEGRAAVQRELSRYADAHLNEDAHLS